MSDSETSADHASSAAAPSWMARALEALTALSTRRPWWTLAVVFASVLVCAGVTVRWLTFKTDRSDLISPTAEFHRRWQRYTENFGDASDMVVVVESKRAESIKGVLDELGGRLKKEPGLFSNILYKVEPGSLREKGLQYLSPGQLEQGLKRLEEYQPILEGNWDLVRLESIATILRAQLADERLPDGGAAGAGLMNHADRLVTSLEAYAGDREDFRNPWPDLIALDPKMKDQGNQTVYLINDAGTIGFLKTTPIVPKGSFEGAGSVIDRLRAVMREVQADHDDTRISLTGIPVLESDEMRRSKADMGWASLISEAGVALLMLLCFRGFRHPFIVLLMLAIGTAWTFGFTTLLVGHLNILSVSFVTILIGLGVDFGIHFLARYIQLRQEGSETPVALGLTSRQLGASIVTGAVTTALAFFCASFTDFLGVAELGLIAGGGILLCTFATFTALPAMLLISDRRRPAALLPKPYEGNFVRALVQRAPVATLLASALLIGGLTGGMFEWRDGRPEPVVRYDHNLLNLQAKGLESVDAQTRIFNGSNHSLLFAVSMADSPEEARRLKEQFEKLPTVDHVEDLASRLPAHGPGETGLYVQAFNARLAHLPEKPEPPAAPNPAVIGRTLDELHQHLQGRTDGRSRRIAARLDGFLNRLAEMELPDQMRFLGEFQYRMSYALLAQFQAIRTASNPAPVSLADLPPELTSRFVSDGAPDHGKWLLQVFPAKQIWDMEPLEEFVRDVRTVDPNVTGTPLQNFEAALQIKHSYEIAALYALAVIVIVLLVDFLPKVQLPWCLTPAAIAAGIVAAAGVYRDVGHLPLLVVGTFSAVMFFAACLRDLPSVGYVLLALMPPFLSLLMTFGILAYVDIPLNPANLMILPLIIGLGVDSGVHLLHDYRHRGPGLYRVTPSLVNAIVVTVTTTVVGFGAMMVAAHRGLFSLGAVLSIGVTCCLFVALVPLPALLSLLSRWGQAAAPALEGAVTSPVEPPTVVEEATAEDDEDEGPRLLPHPARVA